MVELEHERIGLAAVRARPLAEEVDEIGGTFGDERLFSASRIRDGALAVGRVVLLFVRRPAGTAVVFALPALLSAPSEIRGRPRLPRASASIRRVGTCASTGP